MVGHVAGWDLAPAAGGPPRRTFADGLGAQPHDAVLLAALAGRLARALAARQHVHTHDQNEPTDCRALFEALHDAHERELLRELAPYFADDPPGPAGAPAAAARAVAAAFVEGVKQAQGASEQPSRLAGVKASDVPYRLIADAALRAFVAGRHFFREDWLGPAELRNNLGAASGGALAVSAAEAAALVAGYDNAPWLARNGKLFFGDFELLFYTAEKAGAGPGGAPAAAPAAVAAAPASPAGTRTKIARHQRRKVEAAVAGRRRRSRAANLARQQETLLVRLWEEVAIHAADLARRAAAGSYLVLDVVPTKDGVAVDLRTEHRFPPVEAVFALVDALWADGGGGGGAEGGEAAAGPRPRIQPGQLRLALALCGVDVTPKEAFLLRERFGGRLQQGTLDWGQLLRALGVPAAPDGPGGREGLLGAAADWAARAKAEAEKFEGRPLTADDLRRLVPVYRPHGGLSVLRGHPFLGPVVAALTTRHAKLHDLCRAFAGRPAPGYAPPPGAAAFGPGALEVVDVTTMVYALVGALSPWRPRPQHVQALGLACCPAAGAKFEPAGNRGLQFPYLEFLAALGPMLAELHHFLGGPKEGGGDPADPDADDNDPLFAAANLSAAVYGAYVELGAALRAAAGGPGGLDGPGLRAVLARVLDVDISDDGVAWFLQVFGGPGEARVDAERLLKVVAAACETTMMADKGAYSLWA